MKPFFKALALFLSLCLCLPLVFSCGEETPSPSGSSTLDIPDTEDEAESFENLSEQEKAFYILKSSYDTERVRIDTTASICYSYSGYDINASLVGFTTEIDDGNGYILYSQETVTMTLMGYTQISTVTGGYRDGREFERVQNNGVGDGYYAEISEEDFITKRKEQLESGPADDFGLTYNNCQAITCVKDSQGNWIATFTDISDEGLIEFRKFISQSFSTIIDANTLTNVTLELCVTEDLKPLSLIIDFTFSDSDTALFIESEYTIGADVATPKIDIDGYIKKSSLDSDAPIGGM